MDDKIVCFPEEEVLKPREVIMDIMEHMIARGLTDYSGGNMALRVGHRIYSTQTHSADKYRWKLRPDNIIVTDIDQKILEGREEKLSRELDLHIGILQRFPDINCTLHGNTFYSPLLVEAGVKPVGVTEVADYYKIKDIPVVPYGVVPLSNEENNIIFGFFEDLRKKGEALVAIMPVHGVIVGAASHDEAFALLEGVENNSKFILYRELLKSSVLVSRVFSKLDSTISENSQQPAGQGSAGPVHASAHVGQGRVQEPDTISATSVQNADSIYILEPEVKILTAEDIQEILKRKPVNIIKIQHPCKVTDFAEIKAVELGVRIVNG